MLKSGGGGKDSLIVKKNGNEVDRERKIIVQKTLSCKKKNYIFTWTNE